jgi:DNA-binding Lrp family transcriptional regulator
MENQNRDFKGIWIPKDIYLSKELNWTDKLILIEIDSLDNENHCTASNAYFAEFVGISERNVSKSINKLIQMGYVKLLSFDGKHRALTIESTQHRFKRLGSLDSNVYQLNNSLNKLNIKKEKEIYKEKENGFVSDFEQGSKFETKVENLEEKNPNTNQTYIRAQFEEWWSYFPKQRAGSKEGTYKKYLNAVKKDKLPPEWLLEKVKEYAESKEVKDGYACGGARYFNDCKYNNHYSNKQADLDYLEQSLQELGL